MDMQTPAHIAPLHGILDRLGPQDRARVEAARVPAAEAAAAVAHHWDFEYPGRAAAAALGENASDAARRGLVASWALDLPERAAKADLPPEVMALYPYWLERLAAFLTQAEGPYDPDHWAKDVRFALALSVPGARTQTIDLSSPLGPGLVLRHVRDGHGIGVLAAYIRAQGWRQPWLEVHTEARQLKDFTEQGWNRAWATAAAICKRRPELGGMIGSSWFYDPPLETISPRLAHLRLNPLKGGAFLIHQGPGEIHTIRAGDASAKRKALIDSGEYTPRAWLVVWPRKRLIAWADSRARQA